MLTLWVAVVAERQGYSWEEGLSFGRAIAAMYAQSKGRSIGVYEPPTEEQQAERASRRERVRASSEPARVFGTTLRCRREGGALHAVLGESTVASGGVQAYLQRAFGASLPRVTDAMRQLAASAAPERLGAEAYNLYARFRPSVASGTKGWGQKGALHLDKLRAMADEQRAAA